MAHWKSVLLHQWRAKLGSLVLAVLLWLALRHAIPLPPATSAPAAEPGPTPPR